MTHYRLNPAVLFCLGLAILGLVLAHWQWSRAQFKEQQIDRATTKSLGVGPGSLSALGGPGLGWLQGRSADSLDQKTFLLKVGQWVAASQIFLDNRALNGRAGVHVLTAVRFEDGSIGWVNRGWAPQASRQPRPRCAALHSGSRPSTQPGDP